MKNKTSFLILILFVFTACTKKIEIDLPPQSPKLVVNCTFSPLTLPAPRIFKAEVKQSVSVLDTAKNLVVDFAEVRILTDEGLVATIPYVDSLQYYQLVGFHPEADKKYYIEVEAEGFETLHSSDNIPQRVLVKDTTIIPYAYVDSEGFIYSEIKIKFEDPPNEKNYYEVFFEPEFFFNTWFGKTLYSSDQAILSERYYPKLTSLGVQNPDYLPFSDNLFDGQEYELTISYFAGYKVGNIGENAGGTYHLVFRSISEEYYKYKTSFLEYNYNSEADILFGQNEPMNVYSNIQNGYGVFAGYQEQIITYMVSLEEK